MDILEIEVRNFEEIFFFFSSSSTHQNIKHYKSNNLLKARDNIKFTKSFLKKLIKKFNRFELFYIVKPENTLYKLLKLSFSGRRFIIKTSFGMMWRLIVLFVVRKYDRKILYLFPYVIFRSSYRNELITIYFL